MTEQFDLFCKFAAACDLLTAEELFQEREPAAVFARKEGGDPDQKFGRDRRIDRFRFALPAGKADGNVHLQLDPCPVAETVRSRSASKPGFQAVEALPRLFAQREPLPHSCAQIGKLIIPEGRNMRRRFGGAPFFQRKRQEGGDLSDLSREGTHFLLRQDKHPKVGREGRSPRLFFKRSARSACPAGKGKPCKRVLFDSAEEADYLAREVILPELRDGLDEAGIICPSLWSLGWRYITSSGSPIRTPEDLRGRRIRILASPSIRNCFARLGAVPIQIYYNNVKDALASKMIDSQENPYKNILDMEFYKYQEFITELRMWYSMEALCFSQRSWLELDADKQKMLREAVDESGAWGLRRQAESNLAAKNELLRLGMKAVVPTAEEEAMWRATVRPLYETEPRRDFLTRIMKAKRSYAAGGR